MNNRFIKIAVVLLAVFPISVFARQEAVVDGSSSQSAFALGNWTYAGGSGSILFDHVSVRAPGSKVGGLLTAQDSGYAFGPQRSTFTGGVVGHLNVLATRGHIKGMGGSEQFAQSHSPHGVAVSNVSGSTTLMGFVKLPVDPSVFAHATDAATSGNTIGVPATSFGGNMVNIDLSARMHH